MKKRRLIPVLLLRNGWIVQSKRFRKWQPLGNPIDSVRRLSEWASDELIYLDISREESYDLKRDDLGGPNRGSFLEIIEDVAKQAFMPITVGGGIRDLSNIEARLSQGADKVCINSKPLDDPDFVTAAAREFGSQCIVVSIDFAFVEGQPQVMKAWGREATGRQPTQWARQVEELGAGEILLNAIDRDGMKSGYDVATTTHVVDCVGIPVIACGGVGAWEHLAEGLEQTGCDAVAAANIFQYSDQSVYLAKKYLFEKGLDVRPPDLFAI